MTIQAQVPVNAPWTGLDRVWHWNVGPIQGHFIAFGERIIILPVIEFIWEDSQRVLQISWLNIGFSVDFY